jgi:hypothetical protein
MFIIACHMHIDGERKTKKILHIEWKALLRIYLS